MGCKYVWFTNDHWKQTNLKEYRQHLIIFFKPFLGTSFLPSKEIEFISKLLEGKSIDDWY